MDPPFATNSRTFVEEISKKLISLRKTTFPEPCTHPEAPWLYRKAGAKVPGRGEACIKPGRTMMMKLHKEKRF
jgi:hypothetical protein